MPDRIIRDELLESERWLALKDNGDRLAYLALLLRADNLGNFSAEPFRLMRLWRDFGISTPALVAKTLSELADHDLVRIYECEDGGLLKPYLHVPRFGQRMRYLKRVYPPSPWTTEEQKQRIGDNSPVLSQSTVRSKPVSRQVRTAEVKRSEVKRSEENTALDLNHRKGDDDQSQGKTTFFKILSAGQTQDPEQGEESSHVKRNREIGRLMAAGDIEGAKRLKAQQEES